MDSEVRIKDVKGPPRRTQEPYLERWRHDLNQLPPESLCRQIPAVLRRIAVLTPAGESRASSHNSPRSRRGKSLKRANLRCRSCMLDVVMDTHGRHCITVSFRGNMEHPHAPLPNRELRPPLGTLHLRAPRRPLLPPSPQTPDKRPQRASRLIMLKERQVDTNIVEMDHTYGLHPT